MRRRRGPLPRRPVSRRTERPKGLWAKLDAARNAAKAIEKGGTHGKGTTDEFDYARVEDVVIEARRVLSGFGLLILPAVIGDHRTWRPELGLVLKVEMEFMVVDVDSGDSITLPWIGYGQDKVGDKAINMAISGAKKYFPAALLEIPFVGQDTEADKPSEQTPAERARAAADAERARQRQDQTAEAPDLAPILLPAAA